MKTYTIGRDSNNHIQFSDPQISRRHALIKVYPTGKMELVDMSTNGTYVNGIKISSNKSIPITRKDSVVFAHVGQLNWNEIPNPLKWLYYVGVTLIALITMVLLWIYVPSIIDFATGVDEIEVGSSVGSSSGGSSSSSSPSAPSGSSTPDQGQVSPEGNSQEVGPKGKSWEQKILDEDRKKKEKQSSKDKQKQEKKSESKSDDKVNDIIY